jgi:protein-disulfide isomerase
VPRPWVVLKVILCLAVAVSFDRSWGQACLPLTLEVRSRIAAYVAARYEFAPDINVDDGGITNAGCFRRLTVRSAEPQRSVALYLSPDQRFLTESLLDTTIDPAIDRQRMALETQKALLAEDSPSLGPRDAVVTVVEFSDFQCPFCKRFDDLLAAVPTLERRGVRVVFKQRPLAMHQWARAAALTSICANSQGNDAFWSLHDFFSANQGTITAETLNARVAAFASQSGRVNFPKLQDCLAQHTAEKVLIRDEALAERYHINATPTVFVNGIRKPGFGSPEELTSAIRSAASSVRSPQAGLAQVARSDGD